MKRLIAGCVLAVTAVLLLSGCGKKSGESDLLGKGTGTIAGVTWTVPARWQAMPERPMRVATYGTPAASGDAEGGECAVSFFGSGMGGDPDMNIQRWVGQFENAGEPVKGNASPNGIKVTTVSISGTYLAPAGPMMQSSGAKAGFRLLGAIIEAPEGAVFFKLTGPEKTVAAAQAEFNAMVSSLKK
jgi:hypothetical protein